MEIGQTMQLVERDYIKNVCVNKSPDILWCKSPKLNLGTRDRCLFNVTILGPYLLIGFLWKEVHLQIMFW